MHCIGNGSHWKLFHIFWKKWQDAFLLVVNFHSPHFSVTRKFFCWKEWVYYLLDLTWQSIWNSSFVSNFSRKPKNSLSRYKYYFNFHSPVDLSLIPNFWPIFGNFQNEVDCLSVNSLIDRDTKWLFFMSWSNFRFLLSNCSPIFTIDVMITVLWLIKHVYFLLTHLVQQSCVKETAL